MRRALAATLVPALATVALVAVPAGQAAAATPRCDEVRQVYYFHDRYRRVSYPAYSTPSTSSTYRCLLTQGTYDSSEVAVMQRALKTCYGQEIAADGDFGPATARALARAQAVMGVERDGVYGPQTAAAMRYPVRTTAGAFVLCSTYKI